MSEIFAREVHHASLTVERSGDGLDVQAHDGTEGAVVHLTRAEVERLHSAFGTWLGPEHVDPDKEWRDGGPCYRCGGVGRLFFEYPQDSGGHE